MRVQAYPIEISFVHKRFVESILRKNITLVIFVIVDKKKKEKEKTQRGETERAERQKKRRAFEVCSGRFILSVPARNLCSTVQFRHENVYDTIRLSQTFLWERTYIHECFYITSRIGSDAMHFMHMTTSIHSPEPNRVVNISCRIV